MKGKFVVRFVLEWMPDYVFSTLKEAVELRERHAMFSSQILKGEDA